MFKGFKQIAILTVISRVFGMMRGYAELRRTGLVLLAVATGKAVIFDLTDVSAGWRVASFLVLGLIMLSVAVV